MRYTIITPTLCRPTLLQACQSLESQTCTDWEHLVIVDGVEGNVPAHPQRRVFHCDRPHNNSGNTCRHNVWAHATGDYVYYLDDDNFLARTDVLEDLKQVTAPWAIFPIQRINGSEPPGGTRFFNDPPYRSAADTGNLLIRRDLSRWLDIPEIWADGLLVEKLLKYPYQSLGHIRPVLIYRLLVEVGGTND